jgi:hypothetical protein
MAKTIVLDFDDFSVANPKMAHLLTLKQFYPNLKVSLFTIPYDIEYESQINYRRREFNLKKIRQNLDWIEIIPHGLVHTHREMEYTGYGSMKKFIMPQIDRCFKRDGLPYVKGFKAPQWKWSPSVVKALDDGGWFGASNKNEPDMLQTKKCYVYTHNLDQLWWESESDFLGLHGHITNEMQDSLERCYNNLLKIPKDAKFKFISEVI